MLIRAVDQRMKLANGDIDPSQNLALLHDTGDIIHILEDGQEWGRDEVKTPDQGGVHYTIDAIGVPAEEFRKYKTPSIDPFTFSQIAIRAYKFDLSDSDLSKATKDGAKLGTIEIPKSDALYFIKNKIGNTREGSKPVKLTDGKLKV